MKLGTPGFIGARLREAREARGMTPQSLADVLGVSRQAISQYEAGQLTPRPDIMEKLPAVLNVRSRFFFRPLQPTESTPFYFRSMAAATKAARARAYWRQEWLHHLIRFVEGYVELPPVKLPDLDLPQDPLQLTLPLIEQAATEVRRFWNLRDGAISDLVLLLENNGIVVSRGELWSEALDAFSRWRDGRPFVFLGSEKGSAVRSRLDAAHELAHLVLHRSVTPEALKRPELFRRIEDQAMYFAGAFLLPAGSFAADVRVVNLELLRALKPTWKVSIGGMLKRAERLDLIPEYQRTALWRSYARRGWKREEPLDRELVPEEPRLLRRAITLLVDEGILSREELLSRFDITGKDIEDLAALPTGYLEPRAPTVRLLEMPRKLRVGDDGEASGRRRTDGERGDIIPFPARRRSGDA